MSTSVPAGPDCARGSQSPPQRQRERECLCLLAYQALELQHRARRALLEAQAALLQFLCRGAGDRDVDVVAVKPMPGDQLGLAALRAGMLRLLAPGDQETAPGLEV